MLGGLGPVAVVGASGFLGHAFVEAARRVGVPVTEVTAPRLNLRSENHLDTALGTEIDRCARLMSFFEGSHAVINAAGVAQPASHDLSLLGGANGLLPTVLASLADRAGVKRFVHVSSASVQGSREVLDESPEFETFSPYSRSKALGETLLLDNSPEWKLEVAIHRPTSVQAPHRTMTQGLVRLASQRYVPMRSDGNVPLPVCLIDNVAASLLFLACCTSSVGITLQPWEGMTTRELLRCLGTNPRFVRVPASVWRLGIRGASLRSPAAARRLELMAFGQRQAAKTLPALGFRLPFTGPDAYRELGDKTRRLLDDRRS